MPAPLLPQKDVERMLREGKGPAEIARLLAEAPWFVSVKPETISMFRNRRGIPRLKPRYDELLPWRMADEHANLWPAKILRMEGQVRAGGVLSETNAKSLAAWKARLEADGTVVHYETDENGFRLEVDGKVLDVGWHYLPRREGVDLDLIRDPSK